MSGPSNPVFLSYASQDSDAAQGICDALRARGVEVWFDQSELRGGDVWDQKIRRQIKDCRLFVPLISANTNARAEGYFRLEWKLAVDRSHLMADDEPFLVPIAVGGLSEADARVPDRFRDVQWARLGTKDTLESIAARVSKLLADPPAGLARERPPGAAAMPWYAQPRYLWTVAGIVIALSFALRPLWHTKREAAPAAAAVGSATPVSEATQLSRRAIGLTTKFNFKRGDLAVAADLARKATELEPTLALAWGARARVETAWLHRNWDVSPERRKAILDLATRATALDPEEPNALWSQGMVLRFQRAIPDAIALFQRALKVAPDDNYIRRALAAAFRIQGRNEEAIAAYEEALRRDPRDALAHYSLSVLYAGFATLKDNNPANVDLALKHLDRSIELEAGNSGALLQKAAVLAAWKGDLPAARAALDRFSRLPVEETTDDRAIFFQMWIALLEHEPARALEAAARTTSAYFEDAIVAQPIGWMKGLAHKVAGRTSAAAEEWRTAEALLRARLEAKPNALPTQAELAVTLALLGRKDEAAKQFARYDASMREQGRAGTLSHVRYYSAMGDGKRAVLAIRDARETPLMWVTNAPLARDPWFDPIRGQAEFKALLKELDSTK
jgi:tetratricopeptide (TPR) repeat protein